MNLIPENSLDKKLVKVSGYLGFVSHLAYYFTWVYWIPQPYDSFWLRLSCSLISVPLILIDYWPKKMTRYLEVYWHLFLIYVLTITCTYLSLKNNLSTMWMMTEVMAISILSVLIDSAILLLTNLFVGVFVAIVIFAMDESSKNFIFDPASFALMPVILACSVLFNNMKKKGIAAQEKTNLLKSLAGSIAHEMRNPLSQINGTLHFVSSQISAFDKNLVTYLNDANLVVKSGLQVIDITMDAINEKPVNEDDFQLISAKNICFEAVNDFAYKDEEHAAKVSLKGDDFDFLVDPVLVKYVLYNLIGNALHYVKTLPQSEIVISLFPESRQIHIRDTGPGIEASFIPKIFESFSTSGKQGGTGLGLAYCKRTMLAFGGDIHCESEVGEYSNFILSFPEVWPKKTKKVFALGSF
jgi:two-component system CAI-1 autoinducer sensor kinase/phosphatase CqsS